MTCRTDSKSLRSVFPMLVVVGFSSPALLVAQEKPVSAIAEAYRDLFAKPESVRQSERPFIQSEVQYSGTKSLETTLRLGYSEQVIPADPASGLLHEQRLKLRCYNGKMVGPTLRIRAGDKLKITIQNDLPPNEPDGDCEPHPSQINKPHGWNCTNLHTHGLHVSPEGRADNVFIEIPPGKPYKYEYDIQKSHVAGTFWYHPHKHGSVALQVTTGLAGALIVDGTGLDVIPEIRDAFERIMTFQQLAFVPHPGAVATPQPDDVYSNTNAVTITLINGQLHPVIRVAPGSVERWRFIHAGIRTAIRVAVIKDDEHLRAIESERTRVPLREIAVDGIPRGKLVSRPSYPMYPGYRWDVLFKAPLEPGEYFLLDEGNLAGQQLLEGQPTGEISYLAKIVVAGCPHAMKLPDMEDLAACVPSQFLPVSDTEIIDAASKPRICALTMELVNGKDHWIDKCPYDPERIDRAAWLDTAEEWHLNAKGGGHPFHIHVNPFENRVFDANNQIVDRIWRDTLFVPSGSIPSIIRLRFRDFCGKTVLHCHILNHEDQGMMENFLILPANQPLGNLKVRVPCSNQPVEKCDALAAAKALGRAPDFELPGTDGHRHRLTQLVDRPVVLFFFRGFGCLHCVEQIRAFRELESQFRELGICIVGVSTDSDEDLKAAVRSYGGEKPLPILLLADDSLRTFKAFGCWKDEPLHATFVIDANRRFISARIGEQPFMDMRTILRECQELADAAAKPKSD